MPEEAGKEGGGSGEAGEWSSVAEEGVAGGWRRRRRWTSGDGGIRV